MSNRNIFFSYSRADGFDFAARLGSDLNAKGFDVWLDKEDIRAGTEWDREIEKALENCDCLLYIETPKSVASNNVLNEVYFALEQNKKVIPIILIDSKTPFRLQRLQHIDFTKDYDAPFTLLVKELENKTAGQAFKSMDNESLLKVEKSFYGKYSKLILLIVVATMVIVAAILYTARDGRHNDPATAETNNILISNDTSIEDTKPTDNELDTASQDADLVSKKTISKKQSVITKPRNGSKFDGSSSSKKETEVIDANETFTGDWELADVSPKARLKSGYLKIEAVDEKKVTIKSYVQFYYFKANETSYLSVFNAFTSCTSCLLAKDMKIVADDVALGSRTIHIAKEDGAEGMKAGDTLMDAGSNKTIKASITLRFKDQRNAIMKIERTTPITLEHGLIVDPFIYTFSFRKGD
jgi:hypothetical protein